MVHVINYLDPILDELQKQWPYNRIINVVCHGHSVPAGYFATPYINSLEAYPQLLYKIIKKRFPFAVINVIVTAIGGENSEQGMERFDLEVLNHKPDIIMIDYGLNDRGTGLEKAGNAWEVMIEKSLSRNIKVILLTPSWDNSYFEKDKNWLSLIEHADQIRKLAKKYNVGLADVFLRFQEYVKKEEDLVALLSHVNHPSEAGHKIIANEIAKYFLAR